MIKTFKAAALQFVAIWLLPRKVATARRAVMALRPTNDVEQRGARQLLIDVSIIASHDAGTGIQRVVRSLLLPLLNVPLPGFEVRPVRATRKQRYRYANSYVASLTSSGPPGEDEYVQVSNGDIFVGLDLTSRILPRRQFELLQWQATGVRCAFVVYDLLPLLHPHWFTQRGRRSFVHWLSTLAIHADALFCISNSVSNEVRDSMRCRFGLSDAAVSARWFHLGADLPSSDILPDNAASRSLRRNQLSGCPTVLMVGTIEPRKGHAQVLDAFELLWKDGVKSTLIIAGKQGWHVNALIDRLRSHPENGKRLHWFADTDDVELTKLYTELDGLVMASEAEGFGLPLVEAAQYGMPALLRDLPVFREVAGNHAAYFTAKTGAELAPQLARWLSELERGAAPASHAMKSLTWSASAEQLKALIAELDRQR
nr:glycosyltransferase family 1 protein [Paraburkholderia phenazinium]